MKEKEEWKENKTYKWTRVHYDTIGDVISLRNSEAEREELAEAFIKRLNGTNPLFDENRFRKSCAVRTKDMNKTWRKENEN